MKKQCVIIGGGASGLAAAVHLARHGMKPCLLERQDRVGRKLLSTGNGRCNLTNMGACAQNYHGDTAQAMAALKLFHPQRVLEFFEQAGVPTRVDEAGRVYPMSGQAASVLDALRLTAGEQGAEMITGAGVTALKKKNGMFSVMLENGGVITTPKVLVCTGGLAAPKLGAGGDGYALLSSFGHKISPRLPALSPLKTAPEAVKGLKGQRLECSVTLLVNNSPLHSEEGELLFTENGLSGIAAMQLARQAGMALAKGQKPVVRIGILQNPQYARQFMAQRLQSMPLRAAEDLLTGLVPKRIGQALMRLAGVENQLTPAAQLQSACVQALGGLLHSWLIPITGVCGFEAAQVTAGGARLTDFYPETMLSKLESGLFAAGEVLDIDGDCGGFNLQWAWASALTAAEAMKE